MGWKEHLTPPAFSAPCLFLILLNHSRLEIVYFKLPLQATQRYGVRKPDLKTRQRDVKAVKAPSHKKDRKGTGWGPGLNDISLQGVCSNWEDALGDITFVSW